MKKIPLSLSGADILEDPLLNKGTAFTHEERKALKLDGLLPFHVSTIEEQVMRRYANFCEQSDEIAKYTFLNALQNRNEILFYRLVTEYIHEMVPLIYTPTVGKVSKHYSLLYREQRGLYLSYPQRNEISQMLTHFPRKEIDVIVVTDGERILGLGDLGIGGMAIPVGKLALYTLFGGIHPARTLPILLDVGTNNPQMLEDPLYIGWQNQRITGEDYDNFIDLFIQAVKKHFPHVLLQWEDFAKVHALPLLKQYQKSLCSFNDDIQGTAAVVLAAVFSAAKLTKTPLKKQRFVVLGAGSAGMGICQQLMAALTEEISEEEAQNCFYVVDRHGLMHEGQDLNFHQRPFARKKEEIKTWEVKNPNHITLTEVIEHIHPTVLIGVSTQGGAFTEEVIRTMKKHVKRPVIFPLSNPTANSEAHPADLIKWTEGEAIIATGSPFGPVTHKGNILHIAQCNNVYIFPGVGLGLIATKARYASPEVFILAAKVLSEHSPMLKDLHSPLFPTLDHLRSVSRKIGIAVAEKVIQDGHSELKAIDSVEKLIDETMWFPDYPIYCSK